MFLEVDIQFAFAMEFTTSVLDTCSGKYTVQRRNQDECQHSRYRQTTDYGNRHRTHISEPCPPPIAIGIIPRTVVAVVINTGRRRLLPDVTTELMTAIPRSRQSVM